VKERERGERERREREKKKEQFCCQFLFFVVNFLSFHLGIAELALEVK
jgi:hypothetical protein